MGESFHPVALEVSQLLISLVNPLTEHSKELEHSAEGFGLGRLDSEAIDRSLGILLLFQQQESRDELGVGAIPATLLINYSVVLAPSKPEFAICYLCLGSTPMLEDRRAKAYGFEERPGSSV